MDSCSDAHSLPENCIANIISLTSPIDACRMSAVAPIFHSAAEADAVWERLLPSDYCGIISRASPDFPPLNSFHSKKALYMYLCDNPILVDEGDKSLWLDKRSGKKCCRLSARNLWVVWSDTPNHWKWVARPESRFKEVVELLKVIVCTLLIHHSADWSEYPIEVSVRILNQEGKKNIVSLVPIDGELEEWCDEPAARNPTTTAHEKDYPKLRDDGWMEIELGEFLALAGESLVMHVMGMETTQWKSGIILEGFEIRPKDTC